jgi:hypothetical protein
MTLPSGRRFPRKLSHNRRKRQHHLVDANQVRVRCHAAVRARLRESSACVRTWICPTPARQGSHCRSAGCTTSRSSRRCIAWLRRCDMVASRLHRTFGCPAFCITPAHSGPVTLPRAIPHMRCACYHGRFRICCRAKQLYMRLLAGRDLPFGQKFVLLLANSKLAGSSGSNAAVKSRCSVPVRMCVPARTKRHNWADLMRFVF